MLGESPTRWTRPRHFPQEGDAQQLTIPTAYGKDTMEKDTSLPNTSAINTGPSWNPCTTFPTPLSACMPICTLIYASNSPLESSRYHPYLTTGKCLVWLSRWTHHVRYGRVAPLRCALHCTSYWGTATPTSSVNYIPPEHMCSHSTELLLNDS